MEHTHPDIFFTEYLKKSTADAHSALEALPVSVSMMNPKVTQAEYVQYLRLMYDVVKDAEENIFPSLNVYVEDIASRNKAHFIENDLRALGCPPLVRSTPLSTGCFNLTIPFAMGILYVLEGSSLGGRVILKNITNALGYTAEEGAAYFAGYGNLTGPRWKSFLEALSNFAAETGQNEEIVQGANYAFETIFKHFSRG